MRWWVVKTLLFKELLEVVRDRRSLFLMIFLPLLMYPMLFLVTSQVAVNQIQKIEAELAPVGITAEAVPEGLSERLTAEDNIDLKALGDADPKKALTGDHVKLVVVVPADYEQRLAGDGTLDVNLLYDQTDMTALRVRGQMRDLLRKWGKDIVKARLAGRELPLTLAQPLTVKTESIAPPKKVGGHLLGQIVPLLIVMMVVLGAFYPAIEVTAGEKERGTLQTLLTAPVAPLEIISGKFLSVFFVAAITATANIASLGLLFGMVKLMPDGMAASIDLGITATTLLLMGFIAVLIGLMFSALMMTVAVLARTFKEAQAYMTPVYLLCVLPVIFAQLPGMQLVGLLQLVPGLNQALLLREVLEGTVNTQHIFAVVVSSLIYTFGTLLIAARIFEREAILLGEAGVMGLFRSDGTARARALIPRPSEALALAAIVFLLLFYAGSVAQAWHLLGGLAFTQWVLIAVPVVVFIRVKKLDAAQTLGLRRPESKATVAALLLGCTCWYPLMLLAGWWESHSPVDPDDPSRRMMEELMQQLMGESSPIWLLLLVIAASPAVCEELLFRGVLMRSMVGRFRTRTVVIWTALLFGAFHMSAARFIPTSLLGIVLALLALRSGSILPAMLFHFLHNGISVLLARLEIRVDGITVPGNPDPFQAVGVALVLAVAIALLVASRPDRIANLQSRLTQDEFDG